jgi:hypothetical protein
MTTGEALAHFDDTSWQLRCLVCCHGCCWFPELPAVSCCLSGLRQLVLRRAAVNMFTRQSLSSDCTGTHMTRESRLAA